MTEVFGERHFATETGPNMWKPLQALKSQPIRIDPRANLSEKCARIDTMPEYRRFVADAHDR